MQFANYTCSGAAKEERYRVTFLYMGFRYLQVTGYPGTPTHHDLTAHFIHTDLYKSGALVTSSPLLNKIQHATRYAAMSNFMDIPTDCTFATESAARTSMVGVRVAVGRYHHCHCHCHRRHRRHHHHHHRNHHS